MCLAIAKGPNVSALLERDVSGMSLVKLNQRACLCRYGRITDRHLKERGCCIGPDRSHLEPSGLTNPSTSQSGPSQSGIAFGHIFLDAKHQSCGSQDKPSTYFKSGSRLSRLLGKRLNGAPSRLTIRREGNAWPLVAPFGG